MVWKDIVGFPNYEISNLVMIRNKTTKLILKHIPRPNKYLRVQLYNNGKVKTASIHRLVAEQFIPNPLNYTYVNHIDGNKQNNSISNLEWCTPKQNNDHAIAIGLHTVIGENNGCSKLRNEQVLEIKKQLSQGVYQRTIAKQFNVSQALINYINVGKLWAHIK